MGSGVSNLYVGATSSVMVPGSISYMPKGEKFEKYINRRTDVDVGGFYDLIAHGAPKTIQIAHNGKTVEITHRALARLIKNNPELSKKDAFRLLSCNTGYLPNGFAQGLADRLGKPVKAPTKYLWATIYGTHFVAGGKKVNNDLYPVKTDKGYIKTFNPGDYKKEKKNGMHKV